MANKWETDFRYPAMQASMALAGENDQDRFFDFPFSFCLPVSEKPVVTWITPGRITLLFLVLGFVGLFGAAFLASKLDDNNGGGILLPIALASSLSGILCFFAPALLQKQIISLCIGDRGRALLSRSLDSDLIYCELGDSANPKITIDGDDHVVVALDRKNKRLFIEGIATSYQIQNEDVVSLKPFEFMGCLGADITYQIDNETQLRIGIAKVSILKELRNQAPLFFFVDRWIKNRVLDEILATLGAAKHKA